MAHHYRWLATKLPVHKTLSVSEKKSLFFVICKFTDQYFLVKYFRMLCKLSYFNFASFPKRALCISSIIAYLQNESEDNCDALLQVLSSWSDLRRAASTLGGKCNHPAHLTSIQRQRGLPFMVMGRYILRGQFLKCSP